MDLVESKGAMMIPSETLSGAPPEPLIPTMDFEERRHRNEAVLALIEQRANDEESDQDQRETMDLLRQARLMPGK
jgi:hypothetical protein